MATVDGPLVARDFWTVTRCWSALPSVRPVFAALPARVSSRLRQRFFVACLADHGGPGDARDLVGQRDGAGVLHDEAG